MQEIGGGGDLITEGLSRPKIGHPQVPGGETTKVQPSKVGSLKQREKGKRRGCF